MSESANQWNQDHLTARNLFPVPSPREFTFEEELISTDLRERLSGSRWLHTVGVWRAGVILARAYGLDERSVAIAALVHDAGREIEDSVVMERFLAERNEEIAVEEKGSKALLHARVSVHMARERYGVEDTEILDAVRCHTTGRAGMTGTATALYLADYIDPYRRQARAVALLTHAQSDCAQVLRQAVQETITAVISKGRYLARSTVEMYNEMICRR